MHGEEKNHLTNEQNVLCNAHFSTQLNAKWYNKILYHG